MDALNALRSDFYPKATEHITAMIRIIEVLIKKGLAYVKNGNVLGPRSREQRPHGSVYFEVKKDKNFGKLSKLGYRAQLEIANDRGNFPLDPDKRDPLDFILWQKNKPGEPSWSSPWGNGRPGWHIECSSMSMKYLGPTITVHGGGEDLIFPHHEAEIAQSETATGKKFVKIWMHTGMVYSDGKKMSKSLGNMIFVNDLLKKYSPNVIRFYLLLHHYRLAWNYDEKDLQEAEKKIIILEKVAQSQAQLDVTKVQKLLPAFFKALDDNLDSLKQTLTFGLRAVFFVMLPASLGFMVLAQAIVSTLFEGGRFDLYSTNLTAQALFFYSIGLLAYGVTKVLQSCFFALKDTVTPTKVAFMALIINIILNSVLMFPLKVAGLALATSISGITSCAVLFFMLLRKIGAFPLKIIFVSFLK